MDVIIGIDPHKSSHTAVVIDATEQVLDQLRLVAGRRQLGSAGSKARATSWTPLVTRFSRNS